MIPMRDGVRLAADVFRPRASGQKFPVLLSLSPYTRGLQLTDVCLSQNEAGITQFWVPRGYVHLIVDVRGTNDSEGCYDDKGEKEQADYVDLIEWAGSQPWSNGSVGMMGCSYFAESQVLVATHQPEALKAIFPYDAFTDLYRNRNYHGGIPYTGFMWNWYSAVANLNLGSERVSDPSGIRKMIKEGICYERPLDGDYYRTRSPYYRLDRINIPTYFGCDWNFWWLHLPGSFDGWEGVNGVPKRMLIGPRPRPWRPFAVYHEEALRWYDQWLKCMDTGIMEGPPIQLYIQGEDCWRGENEWPLARAEWRRFYLGGPSGGLEGKLAESSGSGGERSYVNAPMSKLYRYGEPRLIYRSEPVEAPLEITGPLSLHLVARSSAEDTDWLLTFSDEAPDGSVRTLTAGWLRASHRELDQEQSKPGRPWHPHTQQVPLTPGQEEVFDIGLVPTCNVFQPGHRLRLEISSCASAEDRTNYHDTLLIRAENTVLEGREGSYLEVSVIPR
jgi:predicted acyl esterase